MNLSDFLDEISEPQINELTSLSTVTRHQSGESVFKEGDVADSLYIIHTGKIELSIEKSGKQYLISELQAGDIFGEMALINNDTRSATATTTTETELISINKNTFQTLLSNNHGISTKLNELLKQRNEELLLKEQLSTTTGVSKDNLHISIKGDPSLRETAFSRQRYENIVDSVIPSLVPALHKLLFETTAYRIFIGLNNGEVRISSIINPFLEEMHLANKIVSPSYIDRHFPPMEYDTKVKLIHETTSFIESTKTFAELPPYWNHTLDKIQDDWKPVPKRELENVISRLLDLRKIPNFYLRNLSISIVQDAIRMQFNCDGTHIVSTGEYERFLDENIIFE